MKRATVTGLAALFATVLMLTPVRAAESTPNCVLVEQDDGLYAVDRNGIMIRNAWRKLEDGTGETNWYYFMDSGRAYENGFLAIDGETYHFTYGKMDTGWLEEDGETYYLHEAHDGACGRLTTGWLYYGNPYEDPDRYDRRFGWYFFDAKGRLVYGGEKKVDNEFYVFDDDGLMLDGWVDVSRFLQNTATPADAVLPLYKYYKHSSGERREGWKYLEAETGDHETEEGWYYFRAGIPYTANYRTKYLVDGYGTALIDNRTYCFDPLGRMVTGTVRTPDGSYRYFTENGSREGAMATGRIEIGNSAWLNDGVYCFEETGKPVTGMKNGCLYDRGMLVCAERGMRYAFVVADGKEYLVDEHGKVKTSGIAKDGAGNSWQVTQNPDGTFDVTLLPAV